MRILILTFLASIPAHLLFSQGHRTKDWFPDLEKHSFPNYSFDHNFSLDSSWLNPPNKLDGFINKEFKFGESLNQREDYLQSDQFPFVASNQYFPFDKMPCVKPEGSFSMLVVKPDRSLHNMPVK